MQKESHFPTIVPAIILSALSGPAFGQTGAEVGATQATPIAPSPAPAPAEPAPTEPALTDKAAAEPQAAAPGPATTGETNAAGGGSQSSEVSTGTTIPAATSVVDSEKSSEAAEPPPLNPRPPGEEARLGKHPIKNNKNTFKPGTGATFESEDGMFAMAMRARVQFRDELDVQGDEVENTFGIRRARFQVKGHVFGKHNKLKMELAFSPRDENYKDGSAGFTPLLDYYGEFDHLRDLSLRVGQYKLMYNRQRVISSGDLELVDRSVAQNEFNLDRDVGFHFFSTNLFGLDLFKYYVGISTGEGRDAWTAEAFSDGGTGGYQYLARFEVLPFGDFDDYSEVDFDRSNKFRLSIGAAYAYLNNGKAVRGYQGAAFADGGLVNYHNAHADAFFKWAGFTGLLEFYLRDGERTTTVAAGDTDNLPRDAIGGSVQVGYLIPKLPIGVAARYSGVGSASFEPDQTAVTNEHEIGGGLSWYFAGHSLKLQGDYFHHFQDGSDAVSDVARVQLQAAY